MIEYIEELEDMINSFSVPREDICFIGSEILAKKNIRKNKDIGISIRNLSIEEIEELKQYILKNQYHISIKNDPFQDVGICCEDIYKPKYSVELDEYRFISMELLVAIKKSRNRYKDRKDLELINSKVEYSQSLVDSILKNEAMLKNSEAKDWDKEWKRCISFDDIYIFGSGKVGKRIHERLIEENKEFKFRGFVTSEMIFGDSENTFQICNEFHNDKSNKICIIVALKNDYENVMIKLKEMGLKNIVYGYHMS